MTRSPITTVVVPLSHHNVISGLHLVVDLLCSPGRIMKSTTSTNLPSSTTGQSVSGHVLLVTTGTGSQQDYHNLEVGIFLGPGISLAKRPALWFTVQYYVRGCSLHFLLLNNQNIVSVRGGLIVPRVWMLNASLE